MVIEIGFNELSLVITILAPIESDEIIRLNFLCISTNRDLLDSFVRMIFVRIVINIFVSIIASSIVIKMHHGYIRKKIKSYLNIPLKVFFLINSF